MPKSLSTTFSEIQRKMERDVSSWKPEFIRLNEGEESVERFKELVHSRCVHITNDIESQIAELVKARNPKKKLAGAELDSAVEAHLDGTPIDQYGVWVHYPWSNRLVHILDEEEFVEVRTNRNHYKITAEEHKTLATKKIGLVGLSVGQSVALTMAMERIFGELRIADFDILELTNLNRIRTGVHNLGLPKVTAVAREIMEIDPYLKITCFPDGLTEENMDRFFSEGGDLDLFIDECDGLDMKVLGRWKAKELKIPVVMEASDRGMVDVERFDLEPDRPLLHGMIDDLDPQKLKNLKTNEDKMPYMLDIVGLKTISTRAQASMLEIGETISTWPQLASAITYGGGITADVVRRILLGQFSDSGRYYVDVEKIIGDGAPVSEEHLIKKPVPKFLEPDGDFGPELPKAPAPPLDESEVKEVVKAACHAPSGGNMQPWKWSSNKETFRLKRDKSLTGGFLDYGQMATHVALGTTLENADLAVKSLGYGTDIRYFPLPDHVDVIADLKVVKDGDIDPDDAYLAKHIFDRETNRNIEKGAPIEAAKFELLRKAGTKHGSGMIVIDDPDHMREIADVIAFAERFRIMHPEGHSNFNHEMRWTPEEAASGSGIDIATVDVTVAEKAGFQLAQNPKVIEKLIEWKGGTAFEKLSRKSTGSAAALGFITRSDHDLKDYVLAGRDLERTWIAANAAGLAVQPQSPVTFMLRRLSDKAGLSDEQFRSLSGAKEKLMRVLGEYTDQYPVFVFRMFNPAREVVRSQRRDSNLHFRLIG